MCVCVCVCIYIYMLLITIFTRFSLKSDGYSNQLKECCGLDSLSFSSDHRSSLNLFSISLMTGSRTPPSTGITVIFMFRDVFNSHISRRIRTPAKEECHGYDAKLHLIVGLQFWSFDDCEVIHCHYSQVHSDPDWSYLLWSHLLAQMQLFDPFLMIVIFNYKKQYSFVLIFYIA